MRSMVNVQAPELVLAAAEPYPILGASAQWCTMMGVSERDIKGCGFKAFDADFRPLTKVGWFRSENVQMQFTRHRAVQEIFFTRWRAAGVVLLLFWCAAHPLCLLQEPLIRSSSLTEQDGGVWCQG